VALQVMKWSTPFKLDQSTALKLFSGHVDFQSGGENVIIQKVDLKSSPFWIAFGRETKTEDQVTSLMMTHAISFDTL
jgi:hypothetical protein